MIYIMSLSVSFYFKALKVVSSIKQKSKPNTHQFTYLKPWSLGQYFQINTKQHKHTCWQTHTHLHLPTVGCKFQCCGNGLLHLCLLNFVVLLTSSEINKKIDKRQS